MKGRVKPVPCQDSSTEQDGVWKWKICRTHRRGDSSLLCLRFGKSHSACQAAPAGQPVAAGDQQISDVAVMPLMKLTQHSLPHRGPLRASCSAWSTPPPPHMPSCFSPVCFWFDGASNASFILLLYIRVKANQVFVVAKVGHSIQTKAFQSLCLSLMNASMLFFRSCRAEVKGRAEDPSSAWLVDDLTPETGPWSEEGAAHSTLFFLSSFSLSFFFIFFFIFFKSTVWQPPCPAASNRVSVHGEDKPKETRRRKEEEIHRHPSVNSDLATPPRPSRPNTGNMGRKKIQIQRITDERNRQVSAN